MQPIKEIQSVKNSEEWIGIIALSMNTNLTLKIQVTIRINSMQSVYSFFQQKIYKIVVRFFKE